MLSVLWDPTTFHTGWRWTSESLAGERMETHGGCQATPGSLSIVATLDGIQIIKIVSIFSWPKRNHFLSQAKHGKQPAMHPSPLCHHTWTWVLKQRWQNHNTIFCSPVSHKQINLPEGANRFYELQGTLLKFFRHFQAGCKFRTKRTVKWLFREYKAYTGRLFIFLITVLKTGDGMLYYAST